ncbi:hypothetical protein BDW62DRAFT_205971 [Aspergillus aurantiobrunneus]
MKVTFQHHALVIPETLPAMQSVSKHQILGFDGVNNPHCSTTKILDVSLLLQIKRFLTFAGCLYNPSLNNIPTILFKVQYLDGTTGFVHCAAIIHGQPKNITECFTLHAKIRDAKDLVSDGDWAYMERRFGYSRKSTMEFEWLQQLGEKRFDTSVVDQRDVLSVNSHNGLGTWRLSLGLGVCIGIGFGLGLGVGLGFAVGLGFGLGGLGVVALASRRGK